MEKAAVSDGNCNSSLKLQNFLSKVYELVGNARNLEENVNFVKFDNFSREPWDSRSREYRQNRDRSMSPGHRFQRSYSPGGYKNYSNSSRSPNSGIEKSNSQERTMWGKEEGRRFFSKSPTRNIECYNCGLNHTAIDCKKCLICGKDNHPTRECRFKKGGDQIIGQKRKNLRFIEVDSNEEVTEEDNFLDI